MKKFYKLLYIRYFKYYVCSFVYEIYKIGDYEFYR